MLPFIPSGRAQPNPFPSAAPAPVHSSLMRTIGRRRSSSKRKQEIERDDRPQQLDQELHHEEQELALPLLSKDCLAISVAMVDYFNGWLAFKSSL